MASSSSPQQGADAHDADGVARNASAFRTQGYTFFGQYIDQFGDANTAGSPSLTAAQAQQENAAGLAIMSIFQTNGMSSSTGPAYQTYFTAAQGTHDAQEAISSAHTVGQPAGSAIYFAMDFDPAAYGSAGSEKQLLTDVQTYLTAVGNAFQGSGYTIGVYGAGDTLAAAIRNSPSSPNYNPAYTPVARYGWLTQSYAWAGSNPQTDANAMGWNVYQSMQTSQNGVAIDPDTAQTSDFGQWAACYVTGTRIRVARGTDEVEASVEDVPVEELRVGDRAVTASGARRAIGWIGSRVTDCRRHPRPDEVTPVRIRAGALGADAAGRSLPAHDLRVSPDHAIAVGPEHGLAAGPDGAPVLVPAFALVNGATVVREPADVVTYWHVELAGGHGVLLAEGLAAESYLDCGNRGFFAGEGGSEAASGDPGPAALASCLERTDAAARLAPVRARMRARALALGWDLAAVDPFAGLRLVVDGVAIAPDADGLSARFLVPAGASDLRLVSGASVPWEVSEAADARALGLCVARLTLCDGWGEAREIALDDPRLDDPALGGGWHGAEAHGGGTLRWTDGRARLPAALLAGLRGAFFLRLDLARPALPTWRAPPGLLAAERAAGRRPLALAAVG